MLLVFLRTSGVLFHLEGSLPVRVINLPYLHEVLLLELNDQNKTIMVSSLYCSPSQNSKEFKSFLTDFEHWFKKPSVSVILGDFNARSSHGGLMTLMQQRVQSFFH